MAIYTIYPVIEIDELEQAVNRQYGTDLDLRELLFNFDYSNDCMKRFWYDEIEEFENKPWQDEQQLREIALVKTYLQDILPDYCAVLLDVSW